MKMKVRRGSDEWYLLPGGFQVCSAENAIGMNDIRERNERPTSRPLTSK